MYTRSGCALLYLRNEHSVVKQLYSDKKKNEKITGGFLPIFMECLPHARH